MKIKKILFPILILVFSLGFFAFAQESITLEQFLNSYLDVATSGTVISDNYKNIILKYRNVYQNSPIYVLVQKAVYLDMFPNIDTQLPLYNEVTQDQVCAIVKKEFKIAISCKK
jgi:hypothetical protein